MACLLGSVGTGATEYVRDPGACPGKCEHPIEYSLDPQFNLEERGLIQQAMHIWEQGTGGRVCYVQGGSDLTIERLERSDELEPWDPDWPRHVALTKGGRIWIVATRVDNQGEYRALIVHELGHSLGIGHIEDTPATYMHSTINDTPLELWAYAPLPARDARAYCETHRCSCAY